jgi:hypothetical protein
MSVCQLGLQTPDAETRAKPIGFDKGSREPLPRACDRDPLLYARDGRDCDATDRWRMWTAPGVSP